MFIIFSTIYNRRGNGGSGSQGSCPRLQQLNVIESKSWTQVIWHQQKNSFHQSFLPSTSHVTYFPRFLWLPGLIFLWVTVVSLTSWKWLALNTAFQMWHARGTHLSLFILWCPEGWVLVLPPSSMWWGDTGHIASFLWSLASSFDREGIAQCLLHDWLSIALRWMSEWMNRWFVNYSLYPWPWKSDSQLLGESCLYDFLISSEMV